jgi:hypothetical protein
LLRKQNESDGNGFSSGNIDNMHFFLSEAIGLAGVLVSLGFSEFFAESS